MSKITTKSGRTYERDGKKYPSVTTILGKGIPKPGLVTWAARLVATEAVADVENWMSMSDEDAIAYLASLPDKKRNKSANLGTTIHAAADAFASGREYKEISPQAQSYVNGFQKFMADYKPKVLLTEAPVFSDTHKYAGTLDSLMRIGRTNWIFDVKTGSRVYPEVALQLAAYAHAEFVGLEGRDNEPLPPIRKGAVLHLSPNGYQFIPVRIDDEVFDMFLSVRDVFYWDQALSKVVLRPEVRRES